MSVIIDFEHDAKQFRQMLDTLKEIVTDVNFCFKPGGLRIQASDPDRLTIASLHVHSPDAYRCDVPSLYIGVYVQYLYKFLRQAGPDYRIRMLVTENTPTQLRLILLNESKNVKSCIFLESIVLPVCEESLLPEPRIVSTARLPTADLQKYLKSLYSVSNELNISFIESSECLVLAAKGAMGEAFVTVGCAYPGLAWLFKKGDYDETFYLKYIEKFCKTQLSSIIDMEMESGGLLILRIAFASGEISLGLAPLPKSMPGMAETGAASGGTSPSTTDPAPTV